MNKKPNILIADLPERLQSLLMCSLNKQSISELLESHGHMRIVKYLASKRLIANYLLMPMRSHGSSHILAMDNCEIVFTSELDGLVCHTLQRNDFTTEAVVLFRVYNDRTHHFGMITF